MSLLVLAVLCMTAATSVATDVLVLPVGVARQFVCTSPPESGYTVAWGVNGTSATSSQFEDYIDLGEEIHLENGETQRKLTFTADARANNTHIRCVVNHIFNGASLVPVNIILTLQGHVHAPSVTYEVSSDNHSVMFSWSAPFTLNISDMEPDILHYVVYIIRDDGYNETVNTTDTHYELQADPCQSHQYHVEIAAVNVVGKGDKYISSEITLEGYAVAGVSDTQVFFNGRLLSIQISLEASPRCHEMDFVVKYEVELISTQSRDRHMFNCSGNARQHTLSLNSNDDRLRINDLYDCFVRIEGLPNSESTRMELSTFDVQDVRTSIHDQHSGYIDITCYFAQGSDAKGCRILAKTQNSTPCEVFATRENGDESTVTVALPNGTYTLLVYDDEDEEDNNPAFTVLFMQNSSQVSECATVSSHDNFHPASTNYVMLIAILSSAVASIILITIVAVIFFSCVRKHKGKKHLPPGIEWNDYTSVQIERSSSSESTDSSRISSGSDSSEQNIGFHSTGHSHDLQYADVHVTRKHTMTCPPPTSSDEPVNYSILQHQDVLSHSNKSQGTMDRGQLPGSYTPDDSN